ncbi:epsin-3 isoform X2 [Ambystoma mexicanum]|uniref:epsin-3 isoform X2 n=1 Tax=Ambystoma mexicanum TaxID=8296 RepID=UPI0037E8AA2B
MTTSSLRRQVKNIVHNYTEAEIKVREATSNDPWGPSTSVMSEIADLTFNAVAFSEVMDMIWRRLNDSGKNWRHVYKALTLLDYLIKTASDKVAHQCRENLYTVQTLKDFQFIDRDGKDQGINVREKAKQIVSLLKDDERLKQERDHALKTKERMSQGATSISSSQQLNYSRRSSLYGEDGTKSRSSPASYNSCSSSSPQLAAEIEQARPQTSGEEELQLQLALAMSREEADKEVGSGQGEETLLQKTLEDKHLQGEVHKEEKKNESSIVELVDLFGPAPSSLPSSDPWGTPFSSTDQAQTWNNNLKIPAPNPSLSTSWEQISLNPSVEPSGQLWNSTDPWAPAAPIPREDIGQTISFSGQTSSDPWDHLSFPGSDALQVKAPSAPHPPYAEPCVDSGGKQHVPAPALGDVSFDVFDTLTDLSPHAETKNTNTKSSDRSLSPLEPELDLFGDPVPSTKSKGDAFDLSEFGSSLESKEKARCRTPESFLDPSASSLVNLDALIPVPGQNAMSRNPFLSGGLSAPSPTNPFQVTDQMKPTLNQMRNVSPVPGIGMGTPLNSTRTASPVPGITMGTTLTPSRTISPVPGIAMGTNMNPMRTISPVPGIAMGTTLNSMTYSTSLPLPLSSLPAAMCLPSSVSAYQQGQGAAFQQVPGTIAQPLLPFSSSLPSTQAGNNPFL